MSEAFGERALTLSAVAARWLGWRPDEFWRATPAELAAALAPPAETATPATPLPLSRAELNRMMERDHVECR